MKRATIKDIARAAGVSTSTVSRALHDHPDIGLAVKQKVRDVALALHYHPNTQAVNFRKRKSNLIGLIIPEISMFFFPSVIRGVSSVLDEKGYQLMVLPSNESIEKEADNIKRCCENGVEGLIISLSHDTVDTKHVTQAYEMDIPVVLFDKTLDNNHFDKVVIDDMNAAALCVQQLLEAGSRRIVGLFGNPLLHITRNREAGFWAALANYDPAVQGFSLYASSVDAAAHALDALLEDTSFDGIFAMSDETLAGAIVALRRRRLRIPEDCSVVCISDGAVPNIVDPPISYLHHSGYAVGRRAALQLFEHLEAALTRQEAQRIIIPTDFYAQQSVMARPLK
ncbi:MAG: LacI family DNA-binding transcriptional regulator [Saprospiraceae bacterium]|jgi:LacI family transcriptional regulator